MMRPESVRQLIKARGESPFVSVPDFLRRTRFTASERRVLSEAGALNALAGHRRAALWQVAAVHEGDDLFRQTFIESEESNLTPLERMKLVERLNADYSTVGLTTGKHPMALFREQLTDVCTAAGLKDLQPGSRVKIAGSVICRQRPGTAKGFCFITLEDETFHANAIVRPKLFEQMRLVINMETNLVITGRLQNEQGVIHVMAETVESLTDIEMPVGCSHDYH